MKKVQEMNQAELAAYVHNHSACKGLKLSFQVGRLLEYTAMDYASQKI